MSSDIPQARGILEEVLTWEIEDHVRDEINRALALMTRASPEFVACRTLRPLSEDDKATARRLRRRGFAMNEIAVELGTNLGRVSEAVNERTS